MPTKTYGFEIKGVSREIIIPETNTAYFVLTEVLQNGCYPIHEWLKDVRTIVDIGANFGAFSVLFGSVFPEAKITAFEPHPEVFKLLRINTQGLNVDLLPHAVSDYQGTGMLWDSDFCCAMASLIRGPDQQDDPYPVQVVQARFAIPAEIDVLKIDTEGSELPILRDIKDNLANIRVIYLEFHSESDRLDIEKLLLPTHTLYFARLTKPTLGELMYVRR